MLKTSISVDWLQLNCRGCINRIFFYKFKKLRLSTRVFAQVEEVYQNDKLICSIASRPTSPILPPDTFIIKFENAFLYESNIFESSSKFVRSIGLEIIGITRIDLAIDFNYFYNGLKPNNLIGKFMNNELLKWGNSKYKLIGSQFKNHRFSYLRFGANTSVASAYLYNKSLEMREVKTKQHIIEKWKTTGLDLDIDVWRLEFSFKSNQLKILKKNTGEIENVKFASLKNDRILKDLYFSALSSYFRFKINDGKQNKSRMKDFILFDGIDYDSKLITLTNSIDSNRSDRIFIKKMESYNNELRQSRLDKAFELEIIIDKYVMDRNLKAYHLKVQSELELQNLST